MKTVTLLVTILLVGCEYRQTAPEPSKRDLFEMKERCAESVPRALKYSIDFGENDRGYRAHYNAKLNRCFLLMKWVINRPDVNLFKNNWVIVDTQSLAYVDVTPGDQIWKAALEDEDLDAVVPGLAPKVSDLNSVTK